MAAQASSDRLRTPVVTPAPPPEPFAGFTTQGPPTDSRKACARPISRRVKTACRGVGSPSSFRSRYVSVLLAATALVTRSSSTQLLSITRVRVSP